MLQQRTPAIRRCNRARVSGGATGPKCRAHASLGHLFCVPQRDERLALRQHLGDRDRSLGAKSVLVETARRAPAIRMLCHCPRACVRTVQNDSLATARRCKRRMLPGGVAWSSVVAASLRALERCQPCGNTKQQLRHRFPIFSRDPPFTPVEYRSLQHVLQRDTNLAKESGSFLGDLHRTTGQQWRCRRPAAHALDK